MFGSSDSDTFHTPHFDYPLGGHPREDGLLDLSLVPIRQMRDMGTGINGTVAPEESALDPSRFFTTPERVEQAQIARARQLDLDVFSAPFPSHEWDLRNREPTPPSYDARRQGMVLTNEQMEELGLNLGETVREEGDSPGSNEDVGEWLARD